MTEETQNYIDGKLKRHERRDHNWRTTITWVILLVVLVVAVFSARTWKTGEDVQELSEGLRRAQCTLILGIEGNVVQEQRAADLARDNARRVPAINARQKLIRQRSIREHQTNADIGRDFAMKLRKDVDCPALRSAP